MMDGTDMQALLALVVDEAARADLRRHDSGLAEARRERADAEAHVEALTRAARELGDTRGGAAWESMREEADREIERVHAGALDALFERFQRRVVLALSALRDGDAYDDALVAYAKQAYEAVEGAVEVGARPADRARVYDALLAAGFSDFRVVAEPRLESAFLVRDLDGRLLFDARPAARVAAHRDALYARLEEGIPPFHPSTSSDEAPAAS